MLTYKRILIMALPLMMNNAIQAILNLTDTWFIGHVSTEAIAALSATNWPALAIIYFFGGVGVSLQASVAQAYGANHYHKAGGDTNLSILASGMLFPLFALLAYTGQYFFEKFDLSHSVLQLIAEWWRPRLLGGVLAVVYTCLTGFFNGINKTKITLWLTCILLILNCVFNFLFIFVWRWGIAGSAWGTNTALFFSCVFGIIIFRSEKYTNQFGTRKVRRPMLKEAALLLKNGLGLGIIIASDLMGCSLFQLMQTRLGVIEGAATQIVMTLTAIGYLPTLGIGLVGTTLVGQSIGANRSDKAYALGNKIIALCIVYMNVISLLFIVCAPVLATLFIGEKGANASQISTLVIKLLWLAAAYQMFDGLNIGSGFCLRGAKDFIVPARLVTAASLLFFVPLSHFLTFNVNQAWIKGLPQAGWGVEGGWLALILYMILLSSLQYNRWRSRKWRNLYI